MTNLTHEDLNAIYSVCPVCRDRVFLLEAGFEVEQEKCKRCDSWSVFKKDFFINDVIEVMSK
jgi:hypothetical protein